MTSVKNYEVGIKVQMNTFTISTCFNDPKIIRKSIEQYYKTKSPHTVSTHALVDGHWPIDYLGFRKELESIAEEFNCIVIDPGSNLGSTPNFNYAWKQLSIPDDSGVIGYDPDCFPLIQDWDLALYDMLKGVTSVGWVSLMNTRAKEEIYPNRVKKRGMLIRVLADQIKYTNVSCPTVNSICAIRQKWIKSEGGMFDQYQYYGGVESNMYPKLKARGYDWAFLEDYTEDDRLRNESPRIYTDYKWQYAHDRSITCDFETWLKQINYGPNYYDGK